MTQADEQRERRRQMAEDQRRLSTYRDHAENDPELQLGGRFAKVTPTTVVGAASGPVYPRLPSGPWAEGDPSGDEPPLGLDINAIEPVGEKFEQIASDPSSGFLPSQTDGGAPPSALAEPANAAVAPATAADVRRPFFRINRRRL